MILILVILVIQIGAFWPVWHWYIHRMTEISGDEYGIVALLTIPVLMSLRGYAKPVPAYNRLWIPALLVTLYECIFRYSPMEIKAGMALVSLAFTVNILWKKTYPELGLIGLCLLSLPLIPSLQFYLGYPMRLLVAHCTALILNMTGLGVMSRGTCLVWNDTLVWIDAPCSGIRLLWFGGYCVCALSLVYRLTFRRTFIAGIFTTGLVIVANIVRSASLFYSESGLICLPDFFHTGIGIAVGIMLGITILLMTRRLAEGVDKSRSKTGNRYSVQSCSHTKVVLVSIFFSGACISAGLVPFIPGNGEPVTIGSSFPGWPDKFEGQKLKQLELSEKETDFYRNFPGRTGRFTDGRREIIIRWVTEPTRKLHPVADCLKAQGALVHPQPLYIDTNVTAWGVSIIERNSRTYKARVQYRNECGETWCDVSSWYWAALLSTNEGPWWVYDVIEEM